MGKPTEFQLRQRKMRIAELSVGASTVRGMPKGTVYAARMALKGIRPTSFSKPSRDEYLKTLNYLTRRISNVLPEASWGVSRKVLNIFIRSCVYDSGLRRAYQLARIEPWLEVPLDQQVAAGIRACSGEDLPKFQNKRLDWRVSLQYQDTARRIARRVGSHPIHLEACWWRVEAGRCRCTV